MKVCLVSAPLTARSGVYRSTLETVAAARATGRDWTAVIGLRPEASLERDRSEGVLPEGIVEFETDVRSYSTIVDLRRRFSRIDELRSADVLISLIPQSDMALATAGGFGKPWVSFVRGLPWPEPGEKSASTRLIRQTAATLAMHRAREVWATTPILAGSLPRGLSPVLVPAGVAARERTSFGVEASGHLLWAGRFVEEKRPLFFMEVAEALGAEGIMFGTGPLRQALDDRVSSRVQVKGWVSDEFLWEGAAIYLGTSAREAFGRSVVEAALRGIPTVMTTEYGAAEFLITDPELRTNFVLPPDDLTAWTLAVETLRGDRVMRERLSDHLRANAEKLTIEKSVEAIEDRVRTF